MRQQVGYLVSRGSQWEALTRCHRDGLGNGDIYATSIDYGGKAKTSQDFFALIRNRMHWAAHGHTAAEIMDLRASADQPAHGSHTLEQSLTLIRDPS